MNSMHIIAFVLVIVGALNWGLVGLFGFNLVEAVFGGVSWLERLIYVLVGVAAVMLLATHKKDCKVCVAGVKPKPQSPPPPPPTT
jgi:uncharacterized membrane protein YuzA (DUF378 family)